MKLLDRLNTMTKRLKLTEYAKIMGVTRQTALRWFQEGTLPHPATRVSPRIVIVEVPDDFTGVNIPEHTTGKTVAYCRVSTQKQKDGLKNQRLAILEYANDHNITIHETVEEIGSGFNENRRKLNSILADPSIQTIIVEHNDRLTRSNFKIIESVLKAQNRNIITVNTQDNEDDLVQEITDFMVSVCGKIYGKRGAQRVKQQLEENNNRLHENGDVNDE